MTTQTGLRAAAALLAAALGSAAHADATLEYRLGSPSGGEPVAKTIALSHFFARIEDAGEPGRYLLFQAGKFFPLYGVDTRAGTYARLTPEVAPTLVAGGAGASDGATAAHAAVRDPAARAPALRPTDASRTVAGVSCRVIEELEGGEPVIEHCMANKGRLGITEREMRTLARTLVMARARDLGWLGAATEDEEFVSIASRDLRSGRVLELAAISTAPLPQGHMRVPRDYREVAAGTAAVSPAD